MRKLWMITFIFALNISHASDDIYITIDKDAISSTQKSVGIAKPLLVENNIAVLKIHKSQVEKLSHLMHERFKRCGGFVVHDSLEEATSITKNSSLRVKAKSIPAVNYSITESVTVKSLISKVKEYNIRQMIKKLSSYRNRYYKSKTGVESQEYVKSKWLELTQSRSDMKVEFYGHKNWPQPTVMLTIEGTTKKDEIIILGGHADSIAGFWSRERTHAPGADDNASGIATITEIIRVIAESGFKPQRTVKFMAYAAEEVGLLGSKEVATTFRKHKKKVVGVVQFDMVNYKGSKDLDIVFMTDYTNEVQNKFMGSLIDQYLPNVAWGYSKCGYGCSDHASWHNAGYPASMPFESVKQDMNGHIHTKRDTIEVSGSGGTADHAEKFARLGIAYLIEMGK